MRKNDLRIQINLALASLDRGWKGATKGLTAAQMKDMLQDLRREQIARGIITKTAAKFFNVAIDYRSAGFPGAAILPVKARSADEAVVDAVAQLRAKHINLFIDRAIATLSSWNR